MKSDAGEQLVREYMECVSTQGFKAAVRKYVSPDVIWWVASTGEIQEKLDMIGDMFEHTLENNLGFRMTICEMISENNRVAAQVQGYGKLKNGAIYDNLYHFLFEIRDRKIVRVQEYMDTKHVDQIYGGYVSSFIK